MIGVTNRKGFRQGELIWHVRAAVMAHGELGLEFGPEAELPLVPGRLRVTKAVRCYRHTQGAGGCSIQMVRRNFADAIGLIPGRLAALQGNGMAVAKSPNAFEGPEILVKTAVLHHQDHDMANILDRSLFYGWLLWPAHAGCWAETDFRLPVLRRP